jgi:hypothetical protein
MSNFPKFEGFSISVTEADLAKDRAEQEAKQAARFARLTAGEHELQIMAADYKGPVKADNTWLNFTLTLHLPGVEAGPDGKFKGAARLNVMVPTKDIRYNDNLFMFTKLQALFDGLGEALVPSNVAELIPAYFGDPKQLTGLKLKVKLGYKADHIEFKDGKFIIADKFGKPLPTSNGVNSFATKEAAIGQAFTDNIAVTNNGYDNKLEVLSVLPGPKQRVEQPKGKSKAKASADW